MAPKGSTFGRLTERLGNELSLLRRSLGFEGELGDISASDLEHMPSAYEWLSDHMSLDETRQSLYAEYSEMDKYDIINAALNVFAEDATQTSPDTGKMIWLTAPGNSQLVELLDKMFVLIDLDSLLFDITRSTGQLGDNYQAVILASSTSPVKGVLGLQTVEPGSMDRKEENGRLVGYNIKGVDHVVLPHRIIHFRMSGKGQGAIYGVKRSLLYPARRPWRQLALMEDALVLYRITRHPDRLFWMIDVGASTPRETSAMVRKFMQWRKRMVFNRAEGNLYNQWHPLGIDQDVYLPIRANSKTDLKKFPSTSNVNDVYDLEYMRDKVCSALTVPKAYLGYEGDIDLKSTLSSQDIRFSRSVRRLQRVVLKGLGQLCHIHMCMHGMDPRSSANTFVLHMTPVSFLDEVQRHDLYALKIEIMSQLSQLGQGLQLDNVKWAEFILVDYGGLDRDFVQELLKGAKPGPETLGLGATPGFGAMPPLGGVVPPLEGEEELPPEGEEALMTALKTPQVYHKLVEVMRKIYKSGNVREARISSSELLLEGFSLLGYGQRYLLEASK